MHFFRYYARLFFFICIFMAAAVVSFSQKYKADSLGRLLVEEKSDTSKITLMWQLASAANFYNPDTALLIAQQALYKARKIRYTEGESNSLKVLANTFMYIGNYLSSLQLNLERLKLEEKRNKPRNLAGTLMNIGIVYVFQEEYQKALAYYKRADSVIRRYHLDDIIKNQILLNTGDVYQRLKIYDSASLFLNASLELARKNGDEFMASATMTGLGHNYRFTNDYRQSVVNYSGAVRYLKDVDNDNYCEATLGYAHLLRLMKKNDSAVYYARESMNVARKDGRLSRELDATRFLTDYYSEIKRNDSAMAYVEQVLELNDSVNSKAKVRELQIISTNEDYRQRGIEEERKIAAEKRLQRLQFLLIGIFIPSFFLLTFLLNRSKIHLKLVRLLGVLSLLFFFEYLTLLLHPAVARLTHHNPVFEILIFVGIASVLIPLHHKMEHWLIHRLTHRRMRPATIQKTGNDTGAE